ncbi:3-methyl-2-oxobutanoate hydroxymethyltransferase [Propionivibrio sp.]|uniref:3-methyl-2-oxobutanoate hydroxymethyltransferase n=1 Tax=Propionivibrio sp. TaxID=2212460 RepID=UPI002606AD43|nr:3-methyl-2-oxobutanoate hydroxymethyltransferase [Propionivibrio sp.]
MSTHSAARRLTLLDLTKMRAAGEKIAMLTCYDASFAQACEAGAVDSLLVGDSLGMVLQGHDSTLPVTLADMAYHTSAVARGCKRPLIIADMPFGSFQESPQQAFRNGAVLMAAGAQMVKIEGGGDMAETTRFLTTRGIPVCAHVGLTPQSVHQLGGYRVQGKNDAGAAKLIADALAQQDAGASLIVIEAIPSTLATAVTAQLSIPTIGIGAGKDCSGQVLVLYDMLDVTPGKKARFVKNFMPGQTSIAAAIAAYVAAVKDGSFPGPEHCY